MAVVAAAVTMAVAAAERMVRLTAVLMAVAAVPAMFPVIPVVLHIPAACILKMRG